MANEEETSSANATSPPAPQPPPSTFPISDPNPTVPTDAAESSGGTSEPVSEAEAEKSLKLADELMEKGAKAVKDGDFPEATECYSRALEIRVAHYGELAPECVNAYHKYGRALLYKAQEEADPLGSVPKKDSENQQATNHDGGAEVLLKAESSTASAASNTEQDGSSEQPDGTTDQVSNGKGQEDDADDSESDSDAEDLVEDEDESDLDLAWKMLDIARAIVEKHSGDTLEKVDILSSLAEVALEREDIDTSLSDYKKALSILERLVEPDNRQVAELNFRICLCLEIGSKPEEAVPYCEKAISICKSRVQRLRDEVKSSSESTPSAAAPLLEGSLIHSSHLSDSEKETEIETLIGLSSELEKKLEDLQQLAANPSSILKEILGMISNKAKQMASSSPAAMSSSQMGAADSGGSFDSPTVSTAHSNGAAGVTHLGVVGRGVKRVNPTAVGSDSAKKPSTEPSQDKQEGNAP